MVIRGCVQHNGGGGSGDEGGSGVHVRTADPMGKQGNGAI